MNDDKDKIKRRYPADTETRFFGTITASVTHELNNVMSIISQTGGLLEDLLAGHKQGRSIPPETLQRIAAKIEAQTTRGIDIVNRLNRFAHSADEPVGVFDLGEALFNLLRLAERLVVLRGAVMRMPPDEIRLELEGHQFRILQIVFMTFLAILPEVQKGDTVVFSMDKTDYGAKIGLLLDCTRVCVLPDLFDMQTVAEEIGVRISFQDRDCGIFILIDVPLKALKGQ